MESLAILLFAQAAFSFPTKRSEHKHSPWSVDMKRYCPSSNGYEGQIIDNGLKYLIPATVGGQTFDIEIDTGSSDTWIIQTGFQCWDTADQSTFVFSGPEDESVCNFGPTYTPGSEFTPTDLEQLSCYGQGGEGTLRCLGGLFGVADIEINGLTIPQQLIGAPLNSSFPAEGAAIQSGLLGLAFPSITSAFNLSNDLQPTMYPSIMDTLFEVDNTSLQMKFSIALSRDESQNGNGGILTFGGIPDLTDPAVNASSDYTSAPWQYVDAVTNTTFSFYSILVDGFVVGTQSSYPNFQIVIDSGAPTVELPQDLANAVNGLWSPPATNDTQGNIIVDCNAVLTEPLGITIGGKTYFVESQDLIANQNGTCSSVVGTGGEGTFLWGDPFLKNVLAVFDWEGEQLSFYERNFYAS